MWLLLDPFFQQTFTMSGETQIDTTRMQSQCFSLLGSPGRIWAVSSIHSDVERLVQVHDAILKDFNLGDRIVYLGNYLGHGSNTIEVIEELLTFRRMLLSMRGMKSSDIVYLRGAQEEMWHKLTQLQFSPDPVSVLLWMLGRGVSSTLQGYGLSPHDGIVAAREGVMSLTRWTAEVRKSMHSHPGHEMFYYNLRRAAYTSRDNESSLLFVNSGINPEKTLEDQGDSFWWAGNKFEGISEQYSNYKYVVRGFDPNHKGVSINCVTASIDGGCGFGGNLVAAMFSSDGNIENLLEA